ncbi:MAG: hypothetical protein JXR34_11550 [Bacteroidales bacterium]|nr:hypothetical protein [Bacteroidales bacterium]
MIEDLIYFSKKDLTRDIGDIKPGMIKPWFSIGRWSAHELLIYLLSITGPAHVFLSTFSIGEASVRAFYQAHENNHMLSLKILIDYTAKKHRPELLNFAENIGASFKISNNHSKIILIENADWNITVVGSGNMTPNPRYEAGVIFTQAKTYLEYHTALTEVFNEGNIWN